MQRVSDILRHIAEAVAATFMFLMFATFILQVAVRYGARIDGLVEAVPVLDPARYGWTLEFCLALWVWLVFWGNSFIVGARDHVTFDLIAAAVPRGVQRGFLVVGGLLLAVVLWGSIAPTWDRFAILRLKKTSSLGELFGDWIRMRDLYTVYILFLAVVGLRGLWSAVQALRGHLPARANDVPPTGATPTEEPRL